MSEKQDNIQNKNSENHEPELMEQENTQESELLFDDLVQQCREKVCPQCSLLEEEKEKALRAMAEAENYKKRLTREKEEFCKYAVSSFIEEVIPVIDNLELALEHGRKIEGCADLVQGVEMTLSIFNRILKRNNLTPVGIVGEEFDPSFHEAMAQEERPDMDQNSVCQVIQKGYLLNDRLIRPAKVIVSR